MAMLACDLRGSATPSLSAELGAFALADLGRDEAPDRLPSLLRFAGEIEDGSDEDAPPLPSAAALSERRDDGRALAFAPAWTLSPPCSSTPFATGPPGA